MFGIPRANSRLQKVSLDLATSGRRRGGPKRPQDRIELGEPQGVLRLFYSKPVAGTQRRRLGGKATPRRDRRRRRRVDEGVARAPRRRRDGQQPARRPTSVASRWRRRHVSIGNGDVLIAAITSCTNTSNPGVLLGAGPLAKAVERGLTVKQA